MPDKKNPKNWMIEYYRYNMVVQKIIADKRTYKKYI